LISASKQVQISIWALASAEVGRRVGFSHLFQAKSKLIFSFHPSLRLSFCFESEVGRLLILFLFQFQS